MLWWTCTLAVTYNLIVPGLYPLTFWHLAEKLPLRLGRRGSLALMEPPRRRCSWASGQWALPRFLRSSPSWHHVHVVWKEVVACCNASPSSALLRFSQLLSSSSPRRGHVQCLLAALGPQHPRMPHHLSLLGAPPFSETSYCSKWASGLGALKSHSPSHHSTFAH